MNGVYTFSNDLYPVVTKRFQDNLDDKEMLIKQLINTDSIGTESMTLEGMGGYGVLPVYDGTTIANLDQSRGYKTTVTPVERSGSASISYKKAKVDMSGEAKKIGSKLAKSCTITLTRDFYNLFANGWNSDYKYGDGVSLFNASHPRSTTDASVFSNTGTTAFSIAALSATEGRIQRWKAFDDTEFDANLDLVLVSPELAPTARSYFGDDARLIPDSAENGANPHKDVKWFVIKGLSAKQWIAGDSALMKEYLHYIYITKPMVLMNKTDNPLITKYIAYMDYAFAASDPRCVFGHNPA